MSIINNANPGSQIRLLCLIDRILNKRKQKPISEQELLQMCRPINLPKSDTAKERFAKNLKFWVKEGLWVEGNEGLSSAHISSSDENLPARVLSIINKNSDVSLIDGSRVEPFVRTITTLLVQDRFTFQGGEELSSGNTGNVANAINSKLPDSMSINMSNESATLLEYGFFLGLLEPASKGSYFLDPTRAIEPVLDQVFLEHDELPIKLFVSNVSNYLPMLDGGKYRRAIEKIMENEGWQVSDNHTLSAALSHALLRLEMGMRVILDYHSDDVNSLVLKLPERKERPVSTVRYRR